ESAGEYTFGGVADMLPVVPGLFVDGVGQIPVPLPDGFAEKLIAKSEKSPFGHNFDTKTDEKVRKSWQLQPNQVKLQNPSWQRGMDQLTQIVAERLGYKSVPMECVLYKVLLYGEGGHFAKHQDTEKEDGMVATLVIQLPSTHEGGDLIVYEGGEVKYRHDFGKADGTAAYLPHFAVHYADAEHSLEKVAKGFRLALVYSLCLPPQMCHLKHEYDTGLVKDLAGAICAMQPEEGYFTLLLSHEYTEKSIGDLGCNALKSIDRARFLALEEANKTVPDDKKLQFYIAQMKHHIAYYGDDGQEMGSWEESGRTDKITWFSTSGKRFGGKKSTMKMNFMNPGYETFHALWRKYGSSEEEGFTGNEGPSKNTTYSRYAIMVWPAAHAVENAFTFINEHAAVKALQNQKPIDAETLGKFMNTVIAKLDEKKRQSSKPKTASVEFSKTICELLVDVGDAVLVNSFITNIFCRLPDKTATAPWIVLIARSFDWNDISEALLAELGKLDDECCMTMVLRIADGLEAGIAQSNLMKVAAERAAKITEVVLCSSDVVGILWKLALHCGDKEIFDLVINMFKKADPSVTGPAIETLAEYIKEVDSSSGEFAALASVAANRTAWLKKEIQTLDVPFSWEMPDAQFPDNVQVQEFLRSSEESMSTKGIVNFETLQEARNYAAKWMREEQVKASFLMEASEEEDVTFVTITKTKGWFSECQKLLLKYKTELDTLNDRFICSPTKRTRIEH
ncbi:hypothetical protein PHMEG_00023431, partial [Phytophthora megakarya]